MKTKTVVATIFSVIIVLSAFVIIIESGYGTPHNPEFGLLSSGRASQFTNETFNYSESGEATYQGITISEYENLYPVRNSPIYLDIIVYKLNNTSQALDKYDNSTFATSTGLNPKIYSEVKNISYNGFTYTYFYPAKNNPLYNSIAYGYEREYDFTIITDLSINNQSLVQLINAQINVMTNHSFI